MIEHLAQYLDGLTPEEVDAARVFLVGLQRLFVTHMKVDPTEPPETP
jgi:hypothetical protein